MFWQPHDFPRVPPSARLWANGGTEIRPSRRCFEASCPLAPLLPRVPLDPAPCSLAEPASASAGGEASVLAPLPHPSSLFLQDPALAERALPALPRLLLQLPPPAPDKRLLDSQLSPPGAAAPPHTRVTSNVVTSKRPPGPSSKAVPPDRHHPIF